MSEKRRRWPWIVIIILLSLNLLFIGALAGMFLRHWAGGPLAFMQMHGERLPKGQRRHLWFGRPGVLLAALRDLMHDLPRARRQQLREVLRAHGRSLREKTLAVAAARLELARALQGGDAQALNSAFARLRQAEAAARIAAVELARAAIARLNAQERAQLARLLQRRARLRRQ